MAKVVDPDSDQEDTNELLRKAANAGKDHIDSQPVSKTQTPLKVQKREEVVKTQEKLGNLQLQQPVVTAPAQPHQIPTQIPVQQIPSQMIGFPQMQPMQTGLPQQVWSPEQM